MITIPTFVLLIIFLSGTWAAWAILWGLDLLRTRDELLLARHLAGRRTPDDWLPKAGVELSFHSRSEDDLRIKTMADGWLVFDGDDEDPIMAVSVSEIWLARWRVPFGGKEAK